MSDFSVIATHRNVSVKTEKASNNILSRINEDILQHI